MEKNNIIDLIGTPEGDRLEYKAVLPPARSLAQIIASFANTYGGVIILGVNDANGEISVTGLSEDFHANNVTHKAIDLLDPKPNINYQYVSYKGKKLYIIEIEKSPLIITIQGKIYVRKSNKILLENVIDNQVQNLQPEILNLVIKQSDLKISSTGSKLKFLDHFLSVFNLITDLRTILYPNSLNNPTENQEGKILMRILFSSCADNLEIYLSDLLYEIYLANPLTLKSNQQVTIKEVLDCTDMQEFVLYWAKKKLSKLQRGSVKGFIADNDQIRDLNVLDNEQQEKIEKILQIRHLYSHRNGIVDEKFLQFYSGQYNVNQEHQLSMIEMLEYLNYLMEIVDKIDTAAILKYQLATL